MVGRKTRHAALTRQPVDAKAPELKVNDQVVGKALGFLGKIGRWGVIGLFMWLLLCQVQTGIVARRNADELIDERMDLERQRDTIQAEVDRLSDPEIYNNLWKSMTMRRESGERYIKFEESN
ncbi:MAG TPA: hypothetical protein VGB30_04715 [bacterium]|jgi:hypothetical protein